MWLVRIEIGQQPRCYQVQATELIIYKEFRKRFTERPLEPLAWVANPRNARPSAVARDWRLEDALLKAREIMACIKMRGVCAASVQKQERERNQARKTWHQLTEEKVVAIRADAQAGMSRQEAALKYGISPHQIKNVVSRRTWRNVA